MEALEMAVRSTMHDIGAVFLSQLIDVDRGGHKGPFVDCGHGHKAEFLEYRTKTVTTVLGPLELRRAYYHCQACSAGVIPKDQELDVVGSSLSPGVRRMIGRVGGKEAFKQGREDLEELAGISVTTKQVERVAEGIGEQVRMLWTEEIQAAMHDKLAGVSQVPRMYIAIDGTGVPVVPWELESRKGKGDDGKAKTREAKLGCVFTQTSFDDKGRPLRDPKSTTYVGAIETAEECGRRIYAEAIRRGLKLAGDISVLGDGAKWIWGIASEHFPGATEVLDLYHARERVSDIGKLVYRSGTDAAKAWNLERYKEIDAGNVENLLKALGQLSPPSIEAEEEIRLAIGYFETNTERMRYDVFRKLGLFVGSGVVEAGCKTVVGDRLKRSGMQWSVEGANQIIALRCCQLSGRWDDFWELRASA
jgi:hypothetical protein